MNDEDLADIIAEIFDGVTVLNSSFGPIYIRHYGQLELRKTFSKKNEYLTEGKNKGLLTEQEMLKSLLEDEMWSEEKDKEIESKKVLIENMRKSLTKISIPSKREQHKKMINSEEGKLIEISKEKKMLLGLTAERYAEKKVNKDFFENLLFLDKDFKNPAFLELSYTDILKEQELNKIQVDFFDRMNDNSISKAALSTYFSPYLAYAEDVMGMFGKPIKDLTSFELKLLTYARSFLNIFKNATKEIPDYIAKDPDLLMEFAEAQKNEVRGKKTKASEGAGATTHFGATKADISQMKSEDEDAIDLSEKLKSSGGSMNMKQLMDLHGV